MNQDVLYKMKPTSLMLLLILAATSGLRAEDRSAEELFFAANSLAAEGEYAEAIPLYETALASKPSPNIHYNLGNAYHRLGNPGKARLHWERSLAMDPGHAEARHNVRLLLNELDLGSEAPGPAMRLAQTVSFGQWTWVFTLSFWVLLFSLLARKRKKTPWLLIPAGLGTLFLIIAGASLLLLNPTRHAAVVVADNVRLRVAPTPESPTGISVKAARKVRILGAYGTFLHVSLPTGQHGYLRSDEAEPIRKGP